MHLSHKLLAIFLLAVAILCGCAAPAPITHQPMSARPREAVVKPTGASLYSDATFKSLFEDHRAMRVGDVLTIVISESNTASKKSSVDNSKKSSVNSLIPTLSGVPFSSLAGLAVSGTDTATFAGSGGAAMTNAFSGNLTVTVIDVYPNGNLLVSGEKQVAINQGNEYGRFSGVVAPIYIVGNSVKSAQVADAKLEFKQDGALDAAQTQGWLSRFFLSILPF